MKHTSIFLYYIATTLVFASPTTRSFHTDPVYPNTYQVPTTHSLSTNLSQPLPTMYFSVLLLALIPTISASVLGNAIIVNSSPNTIYAWSVGGAISDRQTIEPGLFSTPRCYTSLGFVSTLLVLNPPSNIPRRLLPRAPPHGPPLRRHRAQTHHHAQRALRRVPPANLQLQRRQGDVVVWFEQCVWRTV
jgi:hypothetical protein